MLSSPSFFNQSAANSPIMQAYAADPRRALAQSLIASGSNTGPVNSPVEGLARLASALVGGYQNRQLRNEYKERQNQYGETIKSAFNAAEPWRAPDDIMSAPPDTLQQGLGPMPERPAYDASVIVPKGQPVPGTGGLSALASVLAGNPDTASMAAEMRVRNFERQQGITDTQDAARFAQKLRIEGIPQEDEAKLPGAKNLATMQGEVALANALATETQLGPVKATNAGLVSNAQQPNELERIRAQAAATAANQPPRGPAGTYGGTSIEAQDSNILLNGDPASPEYALAYARQAAPKTANIEGVIQTTTPDMRWARLPTWVQPQSAAQPPPGPVASPALASGSPSPTPPPGTPTITMQRVSVPPKLREAQIGVGTLIGALDRFGEVNANADRGARLSAASPFPGTEGKTLNTTYNNAALLAKGEELFNLGVLNGPDLDLIRRTLTDPSTVAGAVSGPEGTQAQIKEVRDLIVGRLHRMEAQAGLPFTSFDKMKDGPEIFVNPQTKERIMRGPDGNWVPAP